MWGVLIGFVLGALAIIGFEVAAILFLLARLNRKNQTHFAVQGGGNDLDFSFPNKQGFVWVLEKVPKTLKDKGAKPQNRKKDILEVIPVRKYARIKDHSLMLSEPNGSHIEIPLKGCSILAVSATSLSSRKWAKRYPIKLESKRSEVYCGSHCLHIYFETSWEKESWCKALRLASCDDKEKLMWFAKLRSEFHTYLTSLNIEYPSFMKPSIGYNPEIIDKSVKIDDSSSKVRQFLKKFKKGSKNDPEKAKWSSISGCEERKTSEKYWLGEATVSAGGSSKLAHIGKAPNHAVEENMVSSQSVSFPTLGSRNNLSVSSDIDSVDKIASDEGTLCWNLLIFRLFFDAKSNAVIRSSVQERIQRALSNMRIPTYIGEVTCTSVDPGNLPPYIRGMRVLPLDMNEVVALEIDVEYSGGLMLNIETRLEVCELDFLESVGTNVDSSSVENVTSDLFKGFEHFGNQLKLNEGMVDGTDSKYEETAKLDKLKISNGTIQASPNVSKWKSMLNSVAKQVSQVPLSLSIRVAALRGTLRLHVKPPPSDQLWFGFTSMPDIDFNLESSVGDYKISSIALFLMSRFKAAIRDTMVLPNCESFAIPWMLAEKDDWISQKSAPFIWINQEAATDPTTIHQVPTSQSSAEEPRVQETVNINSTTYSESQQAKEKKEMTSESLDEHTSSWGPMNQPIINGNPLEELRSPLLKNEKSEGSSSRSMEEENKEGQSESQQYPLLSRSLNLDGKQNDTLERDDEIKTKRMGSTREKMRGLGKRVGEKLEEKRRTIEIKGRSMVDKMRGP